MRPILITLTLSALLLAAPANADTAAYLLASMATAEAEGEGIRGQLAVMQVALNRALGDEAHLPQQLLAEGQFKHRPPSDEMILLAELFLQGEAVADLRLHDEDYVHFYSGAPTEPWQFECYGKIQIKNHTFCKQ